MGDMTGNVSMRRIGPDDWAVWRELRLAALADAPDAFGASLATEQTYDEATWRARLRPEGGLWAIAFRDVTPVGIVGAHFPEEGPDAVELISMWVHPSARGDGTADILVNEVIAWAEEQRYPTIALYVVEGNDRARRLYERLGFVGTGECEPLLSNPSLQCHRMVHAVDRVERIGRAGGGR
ncbi:GNAT family N-acetyltransferase [Microtetraspora sp. AC03309]|uniref:GNAT family N-acetyltransferase n=1 Tax=Microtetraspora sp. AC03309 TaxID=2779376 RepID=UPI001E2AA43A|nr:GNAT family N-acetyltransferase [Microtetraspora sp. AC03309]MCC5581211.1 GNAT family N-acetyltransferase [Microtetraspora sp. AC03309]